MKMEKKNKNSINSKSNFFLLHFKLCLPQMPQHMREGKKFTRFSNDGNPSAAEAIRLYNKLMNSIN